MTTRGWVELCIQTKFQPVAWEQASYVPFHYEAEALPGILLSPHDEETLGKTLHQAKG